MADWDDRQFDVLFRERPPTQPTAPTLADCEAMRAVLGNRSTKAIQSQWNDGRSLVLGHANDASRSLRDYLVRRGWLP